jgi:chemotaxis signal transduction protein
MHVLPCPELFSLVCLRQEIAGVFLYNDEPVPMLNLARLPGLNIQECTNAGTYVILFQSEYGTIGLPVDSAVTIVDAQDGSFEDDTQSEEAQHCQIFKFQDTSYPLINIDGMLARLSY